MPTYQRLIKKTRLKKVAQFVEGVASSRTQSSSTSNPDGAASDSSPWARVEGQAKLGMLHLPQTYRAAYVIDGQHRLYGYADSERAGKI